MHQENEYSCVMRIGKISEYDYETHRARVEFPDMGIVSDFLPILVTHTLKDKYEHYADKGEHVICLMAGSGTEFGVIIGSFYDDKNKPEVKDEKLGKHTVKFSDGTTIEHDRNESILRIHCMKEIILEADEHIQLKAGRIDLN